MIHKENDKSMKIVIVLISIILLVFAGIYFGVKYSQKYISTTNTDRHVVYNNYEFNKSEDGSWNTMLQKNNQPYDIAFYYNPYQVEDIPINNDTIILFKNFLKYNPKGRVYLTMDPDESSKMVIAGVELAKILGQRYNIFNLDVKAAFSKESETRNISETGYPLMTCANATSKQLVIWLTKADNTEIELAKNCIILKSVDSNESIRVADALVFRLLTITK